MIHVSGKTHELLATPDTLENVIDDLSGCRNNRDQVVNIHGSGGLAVGGSPVPRLMHQNFYLHQL